MALPVDGQLSADPHAAPFIPPRDRPREYLVDWSRGGLALNDATQGLDLYDWKTTYDLDTRAVHMSVPNADETGYIIAPILVYTMLEDVVEIAGSFDTNMQPVLGWTTEEGISWYRWFDPTIPGFTSVELSDGSRNVRITLDDVRLSQSTAGVTDTIIAYVRASKLYYRQLRDRFEDEIEVDGSEGMIALAQTGMNENMRFQFSRSGFAADNDSNLNFGRPENRSGYRPARFDREGSVTLHDGVPTVRQGPPGYGQRRTFEGDESETYHLQLDDGTWAGLANRGASADFTQLPRTDLGGRTKQWTRDREGVLVPALDVQHTELPLAFKEAISTDQKTLTGMYVASTGNGQKFNVVSITKGGLTFGKFNVNYASTGDFVPGREPSPSEVRYVDYGSFVTLKLPDFVAHSGITASTRLRWPPGTIPPGARPESDRASQCVISQFGAVQSGMAVVRADGSAEFWPLKSQLAGTIVTTYEHYNADSEGEEVVGKTQMKWIAPASLFDILIVGGGGNGGGGLGGKAGGGGGAGAVRIVTGAVLQQGQEYTLMFSPDQTANNIGHGWSASMTGILGFGYVPGLGYPDARGGGGGGSPLTGTGGSQTPGSPPSANYQIGGLPVYEGCGGGGGAENGTGGFFNVHTVPPYGSNVGSAGGAASMIAGGGGGGYDGPGQTAVGGAGGDGGDGTDLTTLGWGDAAAEGAPENFAAGGGGGANGVGDHGVGGGSTGGDGGTVGASKNAADATSNTGSGGGGGGGDGGYGGRGSGGFIVFRWASGADTFLVVPGEFRQFPIGGTPKGLPVGFTLSYAKDLTAPVPPPTIFRRITEAGDVRLTEDDNSRILE